MPNYRWISYPKDMPEEMIERYEAVADLIEAGCSLGCLKDEPICIVWAAEGENWTDDDACNPPRNCLLITQQVAASSIEHTFGKNLMSVILH